jgi:hypothetical protein
MWQDYTPDRFEMFNESSRLPQTVRRVARLETRPEGVGKAGPDIVLEAWGVPHGRLPTGVRTPSAPVTLYTSTSGTGSG